MLDDASSTIAPNSIEQLIAHMMIEEKAGQLTFMIAAWIAGAAVPLPPLWRIYDVRVQLGEAWLDHLTGFFNDNGARMADTMHIALMGWSRRAISFVVGGDVIHGHMYTCTHVHIEQLVIKRPIP
jgi:hypothetical protein